MFQNLFKQHKQKVKTKFQNFEIAYKKSNNDFSLEEKILYSMTILEASYKASFLTRTQMKEFIKEDKKEALETLKNITTVYSDFAEIITSDYYEFYSSTFYKYENLFNLLFNNIQTEFWSYLYLDKNMLNEILSFLFVIKDDLSLVKKVQISTLEQEKINFMQILSEEKERWISINTNLSEFNSATNNQVNNVQNSIDETSKFLSNKSLKLEIIDNFSLLKKNTTNLLDIFNTMYKLPNDFVEYIDKKLDLDSTHFQSYLDILPYTIYSKCSTLENSIQDSLFLLGNLTSDSVLDLSKIEKGYILMQSFNHFSNKTNEIKARIEHYYFYPTNNVFLFESGVENTLTSIDFIHKSIECFLNINKLLSQYAQDTSIDFNYTEFNDLVYNFYVLYRKSSDAFFNFKPLKIYKNFKINSKFEEIHRKMVELGFPDNNYLIDLIKFTILQKSSYFLNLESLEDFKNYYQEQTILSTYLSYLDSISKEILLNKNNNLLNETKILIKSIGNAYDFNHLIGILNKYLKSVIDTVPEIELNQIDLNFLLVESKRLLKVYKN